MLPGQGVTWTRRYQNKVLPGHGFTRTMDKVLPWQCWTRYNLDKNRCYLDKVLPGQDITWTRSDVAQVEFARIAVTHATSIRRCRVVTFARLDLRPRPHVVLQSSHTDHSDHPPSTATTSKYDSVKYFITHFFNVLQRFWCITSVTHFSHATSLYSTSLPISLHFVIAHFNPSEMVHKFNSDS